MTILDELADTARNRVAAAKGARPLPELRAAALSSPRPPAGERGFEHALAAPGLSFICEVKKASPSKGLIAPQFPYLDIARDYAAAGASAISVLTEPSQFLGSDSQLRQIASAVRIPVLRKDFTIDAYQLYEARELRASAVLLICALLSPTQLSQYLGLADELGLSCLVEAHDPDEIGTALDAGARIIGVNNRDLHDFSIDLSTAAALRSLVPPNVLFVAESGVRTPVDAATIAATGADAVLVGEALMRAPDRRAALTAMRQAATPDGVPRVKICGVRREADIPVLNETLPDYVGFVFAAGSRRRIDLATALRLRAALDSRIATVGVFADQSVAEMVTAAMSGAVSILQLHGAESESVIAAVRAGAPTARIIKAVGVTDAASIVSAARLGADWLLLDSVAGGGSGERFDWTLVDEARSLAEAQGVPMPPLFLAGGLDAETVQAGTDAVHPYAVDVSSGVESDGVKDPALVRAFIAAARARRWPVEGTDGE